MFETILLPVGGGELNHAVLPHVIEIAKRFGARVAILHALQPFSSLVAPTPGAVIGMGAEPLPTPDVTASELEASRLAAEKLVGEVASRLRKVGITCETVIRDGDPATLIKEVAAEQNADLIAMATHGRTGIGRTLLGSVADDVIRNTHLPVLVVRPG